MLSTSDAKELISSYATKVNKGRSIREIIASDDSLSSRLGTIKIIEGKVSDSVFGGRLNTPDRIPVRLMYRTNRISTHDVNKGTIPFKDQVLATNHAYMLNIVEPYIGSSQFYIPELEPTSTVIASENLHMFKFENVIRQYMAESSTDTSLYMAWKKANESNKSHFKYAGHNLVTADLTPNCLFKKILFTPSTKSNEHDETVSLRYLVEQRICIQDDIDEIVRTSKTAFEKVSSVLENVRMVLVDTKIEHGINHLGDIVSADELFTLDSSRFWKQNDVGNIMMKNRKPVSFSKEFARGMVKGPDHQFTTEQSNEIALRYIAGLEQLTGQEFKPDLRPREQRIIESTHQILDELGI